MVGSPTKADEPEGLSAAAVAELQSRYGKNEFGPVSRSGAIYLIWNTIKEPMVLLLIISGLLYFFLGETAEGILMFIAMVLVLAISIFQEVRSSNAISRLKEMIAPSVTVIRNGVRTTIHSRELVPGDVIWLEEGQKVPADAIIVDAHDLSVNESILTGESVPVTKTPGDQDQYLFQGTLINSGSCFATVTATGARTRLASIGQLIDSSASDKTFLQLQTARVVKRLALFGFISFILIFAVNYFHYRDIATSLLFALTLAMSVIPEEIPVAFSSFMALGAYKLSRQGIFVRQPQITENLGCMDVICLDKTGTITENKMVVQSVYNYQQGELSEDLSSAGRLLFYAALASEDNPFDSMERAITNAFLEHHGTVDPERPPMIHEYPIGGNPPMMTHVYNSNGQIIAAAKGAPERIMHVCHLSEALRLKLQAYLDRLSRAGLRILGVASARHEGDFPSSQDDFAWQFEGFVALFDPPKKNVPAVIRQFYEAGLEIKLVTGDYPETAMTIGRQAGLREKPVSFTGEQIMQMDDTRLREASTQANIFARMFPEAKLRLIKTLTAMGHTVGMTGDGVNDAPALKAAAIGIAMGKQGTEMAQQAADLVIADDDLSSISLTIREGRKIFHNLRKSIRYIISIHVPILLIATLPALLGWKFPNIFTPVHIIFLELIMGPTCSIFFEREPVEETAVNAGPRKKNAPLLQTADLLMSTMQGVAIALACLLLYYFFMTNGAPLEKTRTIVFTTLIISNILLTFSARSTSRTFLKTIHYRNALVLPLAGISVAFLAFILLYPPARVLFGLAPLSPALLTVCIIAAAISIAGFEIYKSIPRNNKTNRAG